MNKDASDFAFEEYDKIATAFFNLQEQISEWFRVYIATIGLPITLLTAIWKVQNPTGTLKLSDIPIYVSGLMILVSALGFFICLIVISTRLEMVLYARTINGIRRYFAVIDGNSTPSPNAIDENVPLDPIELKEYLILPTNDITPPFYEAWRSVFLQVIAMSIFNLTVLYVALISLEISICISIPISLLFGSLHLIAYMIFAKRRENKWNVHFPNNLGIYNY